MLIALRHSTRHPIQSLLLILGVALGVGMIVAVDLANSSASRAFGLSTDSIVGQATHQITAAPNHLPTELYVQLRRELGLTDIAPTVSGLVLLNEADDLPLQILGIDPFAEGPFRNYLGNGSDGVDFGALLSLLIQPDTIMLTQSLAERYNLHLGDDLTLQTGNADKSVRLVGLLNPTDQASQRALDGLILADISTAQEVLDMPGRISSIDLILPETADQQPILDLLPPNAQLQPATLRNDTLKQMTAAFELNLAHVQPVGTHRRHLSHLQHHQLFGGATSPCAWHASLFGRDSTRDFWASSLTEALVLSGLGALIGLGLGVGLGRFLIGLVTRSINDLFFTLTVQSVAVLPWTLYKGFMAGLGAGFFGAFFPALEATSVPPNSALKRSVEEARLQKLVPWLPGSGVCLLVAGWLLLSMVSHSLSLSFTALFMVLFGGGLPDSSRHPLADAHDWPADASQFWSYRDDGSA